MSVRRNIPDHIIRNGFVPLNKHDYFSRRHNWRLLLGHYRSFLPPPKDHRVLIGSFRRPYNYPRALRFQVRILKRSRLILSKQYGLFRRTRSDGSCFYRALLFSYLENLGQMQDRQAVVIRLMECVEVSIKRIYQLEWGEAYFLNPKDNILSVVYAESWSRNRRSTPRRPRLLTPLHKTSPLDPEQHLTSRRLPATHVLVCYWLAGAAGWLVLLADVAAAGWCCC
nr:uncharacterized protein LOC127328224 [Lolium perenne]